MSQPILIRSGGQTGVDRAAVDFAVRQGRDYVGWCPRGGWAEDLPEPPGLLARYPRLRETPSDEPAERTVWNVRDSDATLILLPKAARSAGTKLTEQAARDTFQRPCLVVDPADPAATDQVREWLRTLSPRSGKATLDLNIAGPRESEAPGVHRQATEFLEALFAAEAGDQSPEA